MDTLLNQLGAISPIDWLAMATGITGVYLSIKEKLFAWPLFILCYGCYVYISFRGNYFAFGGMNILFVAIASYGWFKWANAKRGADERIKVSHLNPRYRWAVAAFVCLGTFGLGWLLSRTGEARLPYYDAFATCCALSAQWMLSRKHIENWYLWIIADSVWLIFFINDRIWPSVFLFAVFIGLAIKGSLEWKMRLKNVA
ncbi:MAG: nicotinamide riboside transporter PnuC [Opitutales bacterium]